MLVEQHIIEAHPVDAIDPLPAEASCDMLLSELHHRFYNSLQVISTMIGAAIRGAPPDKLHQMQDRICAFADVHRLLAERDPGENLAPACRELCALLFAAHDRSAMAEVRMVRFRGVPPIRRGILLLVAELVTNAIKHAKDGEPLRIMITLANRGDAIALTVTNNGSAPLPVGTQPRIASALAQRLGGALCISSWPLFEVRVTLPPTPASPAPFIAAHQGAIA